MGFAIICIVVKYKLIGNKEFYKTLFVVAIPIMLQSAITNFVGLIDNLMVGSLGTLQMSSVSICNQIINVFQLLTFASANASGIFLAQYYGKRDDEGMANCFRFKAYSMAVLYIVAMAVFVFGGKQIIMLYLGNNDPSTIAETMAYASSYMKIILIGLLPFAINITVSYSIREIGDTVPPMIASSVAVMVNTLLNYTLIFGHFGLPQLGIKGAAIATVIARFTEMTITVGYAFSKRYTIPFIRHMFDTLTVPTTLIRDIMVKGFPLVINEFFYAIGMAMIVQAYSMKGIEAVAAYNIVNTVANVLFVANIAFGNAIAIIVGRLLGAGEIEQAKQTDAQIIFFSFMLNIVIGLVMFMFVPLVPELYNTSADIKLMAANMLRFYSFYLPVSSLYMSAYFTIRSGGNTFLTFFFDGFYSACISFPLAYVLCRFTGLSIVQVYMIVMSFDIFKVFIGMGLISRGTWAKNIVSG